MLPMIEGCIGTPTSHITAFPAWQTNPYQIVHKLYKTVPKHTEPQQIVQNMRLSCRGGAKEWSWVTRQWYHSKVLKLFLCKAWQASVRRGRHRLEGASLGPDCTEANSFPHYPQPPPPHPSQAVGTGQYTRAPSVAESVLWRRRGYKLPSAP